MFFFFFQLGSMVGFIVFYGGFCSVSYGFMIFVELDGRFYGGFDGFAIGFMVTW